MAEQYLPQDIEARSFAIISGELERMGVTLEEDREPVVKRVIHTTADFDYVSNLVFTPGAVEAGLEAIRQGAVIVTDTKMAASGINARVLEKFGGQVRCFISDPDVADLAKEKGTTRSAVSMEKAASLSGPVIFAIGNAPTALLRLRELIDEGIVRPALIIGVPVGFVNVVEAKEGILSQNKCPCIVAKGRKGGSNVAAAICNALLYRCCPERG